MTRRPVKVVAAVESGKARTKSVLCRQLLLSGGVDSRIRGFCKPPGEPFTAVCTLSGHENWVRGLAAVDVSTPQRRMLWLASAAQDRMVRTWTLEEQQPEAQGESEVP